MNTKQKWMAAGIGALATLMIGGAVLTTTPVSADDGVVENIVAAVVGEDVERGRGPRGGNRGGRINTGEFLAIELGISEDELSEARQAARDAATEDMTREERQALFASQLGISVEELEAAHEAAEDAAIAQALADGTITQEQVDLKEAKEAFKEVFDKKEAKAEILGLTVEELESAKEAGTDKDELLANAGLTEEEFEAAFDQAKADALAEAVANGDITAEQAELIENAPERNGRGGRNGGRGNRGQGNGGPDVDGGTQADA